MRLARLGGLAALSLLAACPETAVLPGPRLSGVDPAVADEGQSVAVTIAGAGFAARARVDYNDPSSSALDARFAARIGPADLLDVRLLDSGHLAATVPGILSPGTYPLTVTDPRGRSAELADAFTVLGRSLSSIRIEDLADGGNEVGDRALRVGQTLALFAVGHDAAGGSVGLVDVDWIVAGTGGDLDSVRGPSAVLTARDAGSLVVTARSALVAEDSTGTIAIAQCATDLDCDDGSLCTTAETCSAGVCSSVPLDCSALADACNTGVCRDAAGGCAREPVADRTSCDDGLFCTLLDACAAGACVGAARDCGDGDPCTDDACDEAGARCTHVPRGPLAGAEGPPSDPSCTDGLDNDCDGAIDVSDPDCVSAVNTRPRAAFLATPRGGDTTTVFSVDASASSDAEDPPGALFFEWDWQGDGIWDTTPTNVPTATQVFGAAGLYWIRLRVRDSGGLFSHAEALVVVASAGRSFEVTTEVDESVDPGTGVSLREALTLAGSTSGGVVTFAGPMTVRPTSALPSLSAGQRIVGRSGIVPEIVIDGSLLSGARSCLTLDSANAGIYFVEITNCPSSCVDIGSGATSSQIAGCSLHHCLRATSGAAAGARIGPDNDVFLHRDMGIQAGAGLIIDRNHIHDNPGAGISAPSWSGIAILGNTIAGNGGDGIWLNQNTMTARIAHNFVARNGGAGLTVGSSASGIDLRNNLLYSNAGAAVAAPAGSFVAIDYDAHYANGSACDGGCVFGPNTVTADPLLAGAGPDLTPASPLRNRGDASVGYDVNGAEPGDYCESGPEIGSAETCP